MAGVTDLPFRQLCKRLGAGLVVSEMVTSDRRLRGSRKTRLRLHHSPECEPRSIQIAGGDPAMLAEAARINEAEGADIIDINMGCPAKKVCRKAAGSALLRDEGLVAEILRAVVAAVSVPVTLKIRTGWSPEQRNGVSVARLAEDAGIQALAVHGRTRSCRFEGSAEYGTIAAIVDAVRIPVFANGDIDNPLKASQVLERTGAAGVMIGRAAQGKPWLCGQVAHFLATGELQPEPTAAVQQQLLLEHLAALHHFYGEYSGVRVARKHVGWYLQGRPDSVLLKRAFNRLESPHGQTQFITRFFQADGESAAALEELAA
jgi:tRNA-dihydrouridine synthase B